MSKYTMKDIQDAQYAMQFYESMQKRIAELETENKHLREECARLEREKESAYHKGHAKGYDAGFARAMF